MRRVWWGVVLAGCTGQPASEPDELALVGTAPSADAGTLREVWSCRTQEVGAGVEVTVDASQLAAGPDGSPIEPITADALVRSEGEVLASFAVWNIDQGTSASLCDETGFHGDQADLGLVGSAVDGVIPVHLEGQERLPIVLSDGAVVQVLLNASDWPDSWTAMALLHVRGGSEHHTVTFTDDDVCACP